MAIFCMVIFVWVHYIVIFCMVKNTSNFLRGLHNIFCVYRKTLTFLYGNFLCVRIHSKFLYGNFLYVIFLCALHSKFLYGKTLTFFCM